MSRTPRLLAEFDGPDPLRRGLDALGGGGHRALDAFTPFPLDDVGEALATGSGSPIRPAMLVAGLAVAALAFAVQVYSAAWAYPLNSGGRPLNSWPVFLLVPVEVGILAAGLAGIVAFMMVCGLPRLHHPLFAVPGFERATQDRFFLLAEPSSAEALSELRHLLEGNGALVVTEVRA